MFRCLNEKLKHSNVMCISVALQCVFKKCIHVYCTSKQHNISNDETRRQNTRHLPPQGMGTPSIEFRLMKRYRVETIFFKRLGRKLFSYLVDCFGLL